MMLANWWVAEWWAISPVVLVSWVVWVIGSIVLHELAHGWAAIACGDRTPIESGHMTLNPLVHMGQMSLLMFAVMGIAWGQMPVNHSRFRGRYDDIKVSLAGPLMNLLLAAAALVCLCIWIGIGGGHWFAGVSIHDPLFENVYLFFRVGVMLNLFLCMFNLVPIPPLDGSWIFQSLIPAYRRLFDGPQAQLLALGLFAALFFVGSDYLFSTAFGVADLAIRRSLSVLVPSAVTP